MGEGGATESLVTSLKKVLGEKDIRIHYEHAPKTSKKLHSLFEKASKNQTGSRGKPDLIVIRGGSVNPKKNNSKLKSNLVIICEVKKKLEDHCSIEGLFSKENPKKYACSGVVHYLEHAHMVSKNENYDMDFIGIAYTKDLESGAEKTSVYGLNHRFNAYISTPAIRHLGSDLNKLDEYIKDLYGLKMLAPNLWTKNLNVSMIGVLSITDLIKIRFNTDNKNGKISHKFQRPESKFKIDSIVKYHHDRKDSAGKISPQGLILLGFYEGDYYVLDGQHRVEAYKRLYHEGINDFSVLFQLYEYNKVTAMVDDFKTHNQGTGMTEDEQEYTESVHQNEKNKENGIEDIKVDLALKHKETINEVASQLCDHYSNLYKGLFSQNPNCYRPGIHYDTMKAKLQSRMTVFDELSGMEPENMFSVVRTKIDKLNTALKNEIEDGKTKIAKEVKNKNVIIERMNGYGLYLGVYSKCKWVDMI